MTTFTGAEFAKALIAGEVRTPLHLEGMAKPVEKDEAAILFSPAGCERWVLVPTELIESVEHLGEMPCKDHAHPHVRIRLKAAVGQSVEGQLLAAVLQVGFAAPATVPADISGHRRAVNGDCVRECQKGCLDLVGWARGACLRRCRADCAS